MKIDAAKRLVWLIVPLMVSLSAPMHGAHAQAQRQVGSIAFGVINAPNAADASAFVMNANDTRLRVRGYPSMTVMFHGSCAEVLTVQITVLNDPQLKLAEFRKSRASRDLPLQDLLQVSARALNERCPALQVLRARIDAFGWEGTLTRAGGWVLQDGNVPTEHDARAPVELRLDDDTGTLRVWHRGFCEAEPKLLIEAANPATINRNEKLFYDHAAFVQRVAQKYAQACRSVQRVQFALAPMPLNWRCAKEGDCFLEAKLVNGNWTAGLEQLKKHETTSPIESFYDMAEVLAAGSFEVLTGYSDFFGFFLTSYFNSYSETCRAHIREPVARTTRYTTIKRDGGITREETSEVTVMIEAAHAWAYDAHAPAAEGYLLRRMMRNTARAMPGGPDPRMLAIQAYSNNAMQMRKLVDDRCTDEFLLAVRQNMLNHAGGKPAHIGKYTTDKRPSTGVVDVELSAPAFTAAYRAERAERIRVAAQPAPASTPPAPVQEASTLGSPVSNAAELQRQYVEAVSQLEQEYRARMQGANALQRLALEGELKYKRYSLEREYREKLTKAQRP